MERKKAMAFATAITCVLGSTTVAFASVGGVSLLGFGATHGAGIGSVSAAQLEAADASSVVRRTKNVYDEVVVGSSATPSSRSAEAASARTPASQPTTVLPATPTVTPSSGSGGHRHPTSKPLTDTRRPPTRTPSATEPTEPVQEPVQEPSDPTTSTTNPPVTTTTRPRGVPADWPPGKPIPPMPPNCVQPQLEDNGVWNCQDN